MRPSGTHGIGQSTTTGRNGGAGRTTLMRKVHARFLRHRAAATELTRGQKQESRTRKPAVIRMWIGGTDFQLQEAEKPATVGA